jgi:hypothetical protein
MHLIIEKSEGRLYAYCEDAAQFKEMATVYRNSLDKLSPLVLEDECDLSDLPDNSYIAFELKLPPKKKAAKKPQKKKKRAT